MGPRPAHASPAGFTLVELAIVITIMAILASVAAPRFFSQSTFAERGYADELAHALRASQKVAVASGCPVRLTISAGGYSAAQQQSSGNACDPNDSTWPQSVALADGTRLQGSAPSGVTASPSGSFTFDAQGRLTSSPGPTLSIGSHTLTLETATGFVQVH
jgi:MSHA pilin protein MshC